MNIDLVIVTRLETHQIEDSRMVFKVFNRIFYNPVTFCPKLIEGAWMKS